MLSSESSGTPDQVAPILPSLSHEAIRTCDSPCDSGTSKTSRLSIDSDLSSWSVSDAGSWLYYVDAKQRERLRSARRRLAKRVYEFNELPPVAICKCDEEVMASWSVEFSPLKGKDGFHSADQEKLRHATRNFLRLPRRLAAMNADGDDHSEHKCSSPNGKASAAHPFWWTPQAPAHQRAGSFNGRRRYGVANLEAPLQDSKGVASKKTFIADFVDVA